MSKLIMQSSTMPMVSKPPKVIYPSGVKEISASLGTDDLVRRLKECAQAFQNMSQDDDNTAFVPLALHLAVKPFLEHPSKDVRLLIACCIADVFRVFAPEAPYKDPDDLKTIFEFFIEQLQGLEDPKDTIFKRCVYLLENLAWVQTFNICIGLEENQEIFTKLFGLIFSIVNDNHSSKVKKLMIDMMCPLISEADNISHQLLDIVFAQIIDPRKTQKKNACTLAKDMIKKTSSTLEPYVHTFLNNALTLEKSESSLTASMYNLIYELNAICPNMLMAVLPQLELKLKSDDDKERLDATKLLAKMFSDRDSDLASTNESLWKSFLSRFNDVNCVVRLRCVQYAMHFLINHPELREDISEQLRLRQHDPDENVRFEVVMAVISAAKRDFGAVSEELLGYVKERTLDKKFKIRRESLLGVATLYKQHMNNPEVPESTKECIGWIKNGVLHVYHQTALEDRLLVERILHTYLVPYQSPPDERMEKLYQLFCTVDEHAVKAFQELLHAQNTVRSYVKDVFDVLAQPKNEATENNLDAKLVILSRTLPEPIKCQEYLKKFFVQLDENPQLKAHMEAIIKGTSSCSDIERSVKELLKPLGLPVRTNSFYTIVKQVLERIALLTVDLADIKHLLHYINDSLLGAGEIDIQLGLFNSAERGLHLLHTLSSIFSSAFCNNYVFEELLTILRVDDEIAVDIAILIFTNIGHMVENQFPNICERLLPLLQHFIENGTVKQAKHAVGCLFVVTSNRERVFGQIIDHLKMNLTLQSEYFRTALVSLGHIALACPDLFGMQIKSIVAKVVKDLLMADFEIPKADDTMWVDYDMLPEETKIKVEGMKMIVRWLLGLKNATHSAMSALRLLTYVILHRGDLVDKGHGAPAEKSWLRLTAACCILRLCQEPNYTEVLSLEQFQILSLVISDECYQVREKFASKLHKGLVTMKLPLEFLAIFALGGLETTDQLKTQFKQYLTANINKRRDYLKQNPTTTVELFLYLPDYVVPYVIHLLAHDPAYKIYDDIPTLQKLKDCLWFLMEPLMRHETYSFGFYKHLIDSIKQTKDKQAQDEELANLKLYAISDLAFSIVISKTTNFVLKDSPVDLILPSKLYTEPDNSYCNLKTYLPQELTVTLPKKSALKLKMLFAHARAAAKPSPSNNSSVQQSKANSSNQQLGEDMDERHKEEMPSTNVNSSPVDASTSSSSKPALIAKQPRGRPRKYPLPATPVQGNQDASGSAVLADVKSINSVVSTPVCKRKLPDDIRDPDSNSPGRTKLKLEEENEKEKLQYRQYWEKYCPWLLIPKKTVANEKPTDTDFSKDNSVTQ